MLVEFIKFFIKKHLVFILALSLFWKHAVESSRYYVKSQSLFLQGLHDSIDILNAAIARSYVKLLG